MAKKLTAANLVSEQSDKKDITGTDNLPLDKRGLDVTVINSDSNPIPIDTEPGTSTIKYGELLALPKNSAANLLTYTVPASKILVIDQVIVDGDNVANYKVYLDGAKEADVSTYWTNFEAKIPFGKVELMAGKQVGVVAQHDSINGAGDFQGRLIGRLIDA